MFGESGRVPEVWLISGIPKRPPDRVGIWCMSVVWQVKGAVNGSDICWSCVTALSRDCWGLVGLSVIGCETKAPE